jgi:hypothetical protein
LGRAAHVLEPVDIGGPEDGNEIQIFAPGLLDATRNDDRRLNAYLCSIRMLP